MILERMLELSLLRDIYNQENGLIGYYNGTYESPYNLDKMEDRIYELTNEFLIDYKKENYVNDNNSKE